MVFTVCIRMHGYGAGWDTMMDTNRMAGWDAHTDNNGVYMYIHTYACYLYEYLYLYSCDDGDVCMNICMNQA